MQQLVELVKTDKGLTITLLPDCKDDVEELANNSEMSILDALEYQLCNGWDALRPEQIGALVGDECTLLSDDAVLSDDDTCVLNDATVYYDGFYQIRDPLVALLRDGTVYFSLV